MKYLGRIFGGMFFTILSIVVSAQSASAATIMTDWTNASDITHEYLSTQNPEKCNHETWSIATRPDTIYPFPAESLPKERCVYHAKGFIYASYSRFWGGSSPYMYEGGYAVALEENYSSGTLIPVVNLPQGIYSVAGSSSLYSQGTPAYSTSGFTLVERKDFASNLILDKEHNVYTYDGQVKAMTDGNQKELLIHGVGFSLNGQWAVLFSDKQIIRLSMVTHEQKIIAEGQFGNWYEPISIDGAISNDGTVVAFTGKYLGMQILSISQTCLTQPFMYPTVPTPHIESPCFIKNVTQYVDPYASLVSPQGGARGGYGNLRISQDNAAVTYQTNDMNGINWHRISFRPQPIIQYLALGDSFASGEGEELDGNYLAGTNIFGNYFRGIPREMCHLSNRSYPMLLGNSMQLSRGSDMRSVACSGAEVKDIWIPHLSAPYVDDTYLGQNTFTPVGTRPRLAPILFNQATKLKDAALNDYTPGRVRQVELVQKAKPAVMTVMIGGNDLNFGGTLKDCILQSVNPINYLKTYNSDSICSNINGNMKAAKANEVMSMYPKLLEFYNQLKIASPNTKTFVIGYPQFYTDNAQCAPHFVVGAVIQKDREAIRDLVDLANMTIHHAANDAGLTYIDISSALGSTAMCGDSSAVSDINAEVYRKLMLKIMKYADNPMLLNKELMAAASVSSAITRYKSLLENSDMIEERVVDPMAVYYSMVQEMLHPNSKGHQLIFDRISKGLGADGLYSLSCDEKIVLCPSGNVIGPVQGATISGSKIMSDEIEYHDESEKIDVAYQNSEDKLEHGILYKGKPAAISVHEDSLGLSAPIDGSPVVTLHSAPTMLGTMTKSKDGVFELSTGAMKKEIEAGWHMLHITGNMTNGRSFDVYRSLFIRGPEGDYDDNGILDTEMLCILSVNCADEDSIIENKLDGNTAVANPSEYKKENVVDGLLNVEHMPARPVTTDWESDARGGPFFPKVTLTDYQSGLGGLSRENSSLLSLNTLIALGITASLVGVALATERIRKI